MAVLKKHGLVATAEEKNADNGRASGRARSRSNGVTGSHTVADKPTATQKTANDLGVKRETVSRRVSEAAKDMGWEGRCSVDLTN